MAAAFFGILLLIVGIAWNLFSSTKDQTSEVKKLRKENNEFIKYSNPITIQDIKFSSSGYNGKGTLSEALVQIYQEDKFIIYTLK